AVTFGANFRITDESFPPAFTYWDPEVSDWHIQDPTSRPGYMGDYDQAVADNDCFYTTWGDNRHPDVFHANQPDVRFAKIPVGGAGGVSAPPARAGRPAPRASRPEAAASPPVVEPSRAAGLSAPTPAAVLWTDVRKPATWGQVSGEPAPAR